MIYEMRCFESKNAWEDEEDSFVVAWETKKTTENTLTIRGKLLMY